MTVDGQQLLTAAEVTWNLLEPSAGPAAAEAAAAGWAVLVKDAVANGRLTPAGGRPAPLTALAVARSLTEDAIALAGGEGSAPGRADNGKTARAAGAKAC